jgi:hypothetical protein
MSTETATCRVTSRAGGSVAYWGYAPLSFAGADRAFDRVACRAYLAGFYGAELGLKAGKEPRVPLDYRRGASTEMPFSSFVKSGK